MSTAHENQTNVLDGKRVAFLGKLGGVNKREAQAIVRQHGGAPVEANHPQPDMIVLGADELPLGQPLQKLSQSARERVAGGELRILSETQFWQLLGLMDDELHAPKLYTPAMLADLLQVSVATIRRWHRRGLIVPAREVLRLPYFDFQEVATARRLAQLIATGASAYAIEKQLVELSRYVPEVERPLAQLTIITEGRRVLLRQGEGLIEAGGQLRIDFEAMDAEGSLSDVGEAPITLNLDLAPSAGDEPTLDELIESANALEEEGRLEEAAETYRAALSAGGPSAEICFQLAEVLYRLGDTHAARERYYMAIELDEDYVEARANLGCVLAETGQLELAVAAFHGALRYHDDYPDAHYHLARTLDELDQPQAADHHWKAFLRLAPDSPWAETARARLN